MKHAELPNVSPDQLRERAWKSIETASRLLEHDTDAAAREVAFAGECILKARYCTKNRKPEYPGNREARKALGFPEQLFKHDLEILLTATNDVNIKTSSYHNIDWSRLTNWQTDFRYVPVDTVPSEQVAAQIEETRKLYFAVNELDLVEATLRFARVYELTCGRANLIALTQGREHGEWELWVSAWKYPSGAGDSTANVDLLFLRETDEHLASYVILTRLFDPSHGFVQHCNQVVTIPPGASNFVVHIAGNLIYPFPTPPPLFAVRSASLSREQAAAWVSAAAP
jgi:hypothetical protein